MTDIKKIEPDSFTWTSGEDNLGEKGEVYVHMSMYIGGLSFDERDEIFRWVQDKFDLRKAKIK